VCQGAGGVRRAGLPPASEGGAICADECPYGSVRGLLGNRYQCEWIIMIHGIIIQSSVYYERGNVYVRE
jgi:hypothetical protein